MALPTPRTWTTGEDYTAARMNTLRDGLSSLNSAVGLVVFNPATSGTATYLKVTRPTATSQILEGWVTGEAFPRIRIRPQGIGFGLGTSDPPHFLESIDLGGGVHELRMLGNFGAERMRLYTGPLIFEEEPQTGTLSYVEFPSIFAPPAPPTGVVRVFAGESLGVLKLMARFPTGTPQHLASE